MTLSYDVASKIIQEAMLRAREASYNPMGITVLDSSGNIVAFGREDGATMFRFEISRGKAWAAVGMGVSTRVLFERAKDNPTFFTSLASTADGKFLAQTGAVLIKDDSGAVVGAAGASGGTGDQDEEICIHGIKAVGLTPA